MADMPRWTIEACVQVRQGDERSEIGKCERCGAVLYACLYRIKDNQTGIVHTVGSSCVKVLTGETVSGLNRQAAGYRAALADEETERERLVRVQRFIEANPAIMAFLDEHIARVHEACDRVLQEWHNAGADPLKYPRLPSAEIWESFREQVFKRGSLSEKQTACVQREMGRNHKAAMPERKVRNTVTGKIERIDVRPGYPKYYGHKALEIVVELRDDNGAIAVVKAAENTGFMDQLEEMTLGSLSYGHTVNAIAEGLKGMKSLTVKGTVKGHRATGGVYYLTRCALVTP